MFHAPLIATLVIGLGLAFVLATIANRMRLSPLVGYLIAGVLIGPFTPGFVGDQVLARQLAEIGVILLMFGTGLHFSLHELLSVRATAIPGALGQMALVTLLGFGLTQLVGWPMGASAVFGLALSVASTVVVLRALQERRTLETNGGRIAVGWLIVQDLAMILALVLLPALAGFLGSDSERSSDAANLLAFGRPESLWGALGLTLGKLVAFFILMIVVGRRIIPWVLHYVAHTGSRELFRLAVLSIALGVAFGAAELFGVSFALGAFVAGMILAESQLSQRAAQETLPLRDAFAVLFFVSIGMLFDPAILIREPLLVAATLLIIVVGNGVVATVIALALRHPMEVALTLGVGLAQIGEFSFILAGLGVQLRLLPEAAQDLILAGALLSILLNPLLLAALDKLRPKISARETIESGPQSSMVKMVKLPISRLTDHAVLVGYGRVGCQVAQTLKHAKQPFLVIEEEQETIDVLREQGIEVIAGNATMPGLLEAANVAEARWLISAIPSPFESGSLIEHAHASNPKVQIIARANTDAEVAYLTKLGVDLIIIVSEQEIARGISEHILKRIS